MFFSKKTLLSVSVLLASVFAQEATAPKDSAVVKLTNDNFKSFIEENPLVLAEFFAPWCGHCKKLAPEFVKAAQVLQEGYQIPIAQIDCTEDVELCQDQQVQGYPTLKVFKNGNMDPDTVPAYNGGRTADAIIEYMIKQSLPSVSTVEDSAELDELLTNTTRPVIVNYGIEDITKQMLIIADDLNEAYSFVYVPGTKKDAKKLALYLPGAKGEPIIYEEDIKEAAKNPEDIEKWLKVEALPYFGEIDGSIFQLYIQSELPMAYFFYTTPEELKEYTEYFTELGKTHRGSINFVAIDSAQFGRHATNLNMKEQFPLFAIHNLTSNMKFGLPQLAEEDYEKLSEPATLSKKDISKLIEDFVEGSAEPIVQSEEIPEVQESNVFKLVGKTHDSIIFDETKDVLVKYYAPWCGHCKRLNPIYEELADILANDKEASQKIVISEIDDTINDVNGVDVPGYPTIVLYPAGVNAEPILFEDARTVEAFLAFLKAKGTTGIDGPSIYEDYKKKLKAEQKAKREALNDDDDDDDYEHDEL